jgi:protein CpxP
MEGVMIRFRTLTVGVLLAVLMASGAVFAQGPGGRGGRGGRGGVGPGDLGLPLARLNLSDTQRQQIRDLTEKRRQEGEPIQQRLRMAMEARRSAMDASPVNEGAIRATTADLVAAETDAAILQAHLRADVLAVLTPEQQDQLKTLQAQRDNRTNTRPARRRGQ